MSDWINHNLPCIECSSSDAMQESEHHFKCFSCGKVFLKRDVRCSRTEEQGSKMSIKTELIDKGDYYDLKQRGLSKQTCQKYGITCVKYSGSFGHGDNLHYLNDEWVYLFNYYHNNSIIKQKLRPCSNKEYKILGGSTFREFYGQSIFKVDSSRILVITEGEFDAAVIYQEAGFNAVSVPDGAQSLLKCMVNNFDYISGFKYIIIAMDNDKPSQDVISKLLESEIVDKLGPGKLRIAKWTLKDANELLLAGKSPDIKKALWDAEEFRPEDLFTASDFVEESLKDPEMGYKTPWESLSKAVMGWGENTVNTIAAADGIGKTEIVDEIIYTCFINNQSVWLYSSEQKGSQTFRRQAGKHMNLPLHIPGIKADNEKLKEIINLYQQKLILWKPRKLVVTDELINRMNYVHISNGVKIFIIDHLKGIESQMTNPNVEMGKLLAELKLFVETNSSVVILLSHVAKDKKQGKIGKEDESWNRGRIPTKENIYGSSSISAWSDVILSLSRNVESENPDEACITKISVLKNRLMGNRGQKAIYIKYIEDTGRLIEIEPIDYSGDNE